MKPFTYERARSPVEAAAAAANNPAAKFIAGGTNLLDLMKLQIETGSGVRKPSGATTVVQPAASYSRQWRSCSA